MPTLTLTKNYADATLLLANDFDVFLDELETFLNTTKLNDDNIQDAGITGSEKIMTASIPAAKILTANITTAKIADSAITTAKITDDNVTTAKLNDLAITAAKINTSAVTTGKIAAGNVTRAKLRTTNYSISSVAAGSSTSIGESLVASVTLTTTGRPVLLMLISGGTNDVSYVEIGFPTLINTSPRGTLHGGFYRSASAISYSAIKGNFSLNSIETYETYITMKYPVSAFTHIDSPSAGTHTYSFYIYNPTLTYRVKWHNLKLVAVEL